MVALRARSETPAVIPCANPKAQYLAHIEDVDQAVRRVMDSGWYVLGKEVESFESEFAAYCRTTHCLGVGSGTEALHLALSALGVGPGDEVITASFTASATAAAISLCGAVPVFADVDPETLTLDPKAVQKVLTPRSKALVPVHLYGHPVDMDAMLAIAENNGLAVVEDCAQAPGALWKGQPVGSIGHVGCFSFYPTKNLGALGDGGAVVTKDYALARKMRTMREYGWKERFVSSEVGWNTRLDELQAAILRAKLPHLDTDNQARRTLASLYAEELADLPLALPQEDRNALHVYHLFVIRSTRRDALLAHLRDNGVGAGVHYPVACHEQPAFSGECEPMPETEKASAEVLSLPMFPELSFEQAGRVVGAVRSFFNG